jgi:hypothetical protein
MHNIEKSNNATILIYLVHILEEIRNTLGISHTENNYKKTKTTIFGYAKYTSFL